MLDLGKRLGVVLLMGFFIGLLFVGGLQVKAETITDTIMKNWVKPVEGTITDTFGTRNGKHKGIDVAAPEGEKVVTVAEGKVTKSYYSSTYGHVVFIQHPEGYETVYAHLNKRLVAEGHEVTRGQTIGIIGNTGVSTGTHLHFEVHKGEWTIDKAHALDPLFVFETTKTETVSAETKNEEQPKWSESKLKKAKELNDENKQASHEVVTVASGDSLWKISSDHKVTIQSIQEWNNLKTHVIHPGQELVIYSDLEKSYVVQKGDTITSIAQEFAVNANDIKESNHLRNENIYPNQVLLITRK
ncbi:peptidoglycan DD-metalloendopeptidase family protein [Metabacillus herbersteinensis]|uniref:Peptidoglycan DD-metalloendopeptidase family protein n=1 Tax=Metabacillus herbersteinensis TaxID=283816 RepID=A0ABV6GD17_9BACI